MATGERLIFLPGASGNLGVPFDLAGRTRRQTVLQRTLVPSVMALVVVIAAGCGLMKKSEKPPPEPVTVSATQSGTTVELVSGQALVVRLPSNPTTGYRWIYVEPKEREPASTGEFLFCALLC